MHRSVLEDHNDNEKKTTDGKSSMHPEVLIYAITPNSKAHKKSKNNSS